MTTFESVNLSRSQEVVEEAWERQSASPDTARVFRVLWYRKWHILACALFIGLAAFVLAARQPEQFTAETNILLDPRKNNVVLAADQIVSDLEFTNATVESEVARIGSFSVISKIVKEIGYNRLALLDPGERDGSGLIGIIDQIKGLLSPSKARLAGATESEALQRVIYAVARGTRAQRVGNSFVIRLQVTTPDPDLSAEIANELTEHYIAEQVAERRAIAAAATRWHEDKLASRREELAAAEERVEGLRRESLTSTGADAEVLSLQLTEAARIHAEAQSNLAAAKSRLSALQNDLAQNGFRAVAESQLSEPFLRLIAEEEALYLEAQRLAEDFGERHPERRANARELSRINERLEAAVGNLLKSRAGEIAELSALEAALRTDLEAIQSRIVDASAATQQLRQREIEVSSVRESYEQLVSRLAEIRAQADLQLSDGRILNLAQIPTGPSAPRPKFIGAIGASIGLSVGLFAVLIFEALGCGMTSREELQRLTGVSEISVLPMDNFGSAGGILSRLTEPRFVPIAERLRQMHTIMAHHETAGSQILLVTSACPNEGRSSVALALAYLSADAAMRTLLISADEWAISQGAQHDGLKDDAGRQHILPVGEFLDCWVLGASNQGSWYAAVEMQIDDLRARYDVVVIDGPSLRARSDALQLAGLADQIALVVEAIKTPKRAVSDCLNLLQGIGRAPSVCVLNKSDARLDPDLHIGAEQPV